VTAHAAFFKAGEALNIKMVKIPVDSNYQVDIRKVERAINSNTCALAGSTPNFPNGICDDIEALSNLAVKYKLPLHVDACLGGLLIAFYGAANIKFQKIDFRLPGVTSISADYHKYALCPKGISILLYSDRDYRKHQYFIYPHFMGGLYPSPGFEGSRSPALAVASYAVILHLGKNRYINQAKAIHECVKKIRNWVRDNLKELEVIGNPEVCSVAVKGPKAILIQDTMSGKGWHMNMINNPFGFMFVVTSANIANIDNGLFFKDLKDCYDKVFNIIIYN
jgi:sphinganine-1-phosphate aldolase